MKKFFTLALTICILNNAFAQNETNVLIKVFSNTYTKKESSDFIKSGFGLSGAYVYKFSKSDAILGTAIANVNGIKQATYGTSGTVFTYGLSVGYRRYIENFHAQASLGYLDGSVTLSGITTTAPLTLPRTIGGSIGIGYDINVSKTNAITIFSDYNLYGKKASFSSLNFGVGYSFQSADRN